MKIMVCVLFAIICLLYGVEVTGSRYDDSLAIQSLYESIHHTEAQVSLARLRKWGTFSLDSCPYIQMEGDRVVEVDFAMSIWEQLTDIPSEIGNLTELRKLSIQCAGSLDTIELPGEIANLQNLKEIRVNGINRIGGPNGQMRYDYIRLRNVPGELLSLQNLEVIDFCLTTLNYNDYYECLQLPKVSTVLFQDVASWDNSSYIEYTEDSSALFITSSLGEVVYEWYSAASQSLVYVGDTLNANLFPFDDEYYLVPSSETFNNRNCSLGIFFLKGLKPLDHGDSLNLALGVEMLHDSSGYYLKNSPLLNMDDSLVWYQITANYWDGGKGSNTGGVKYSDSIVLGVKDTLFFKDFVDNNFDYDPEGGFYSNYEQLLTSVVFNSTSNFEWRSELFRLGNWIKDDNTDNSSQTHLKKTGHSLYVAGGLIHLNSLFSETMSFTLFDLRGRIVSQFHRNLSAGDNKIAFPHSIAKGSYIMHIKSDVGTALYHRIIM